MPANNDTFEAIAPIEPTGESVVMATGHPDVTVLIYASGFKTVWDGGEGWTLAKKCTVGHEGVTCHIPKVLHLCVRLQGPVGEEARVVIG